LSHSPEHPRSAGNTRLSGGWGWGWPKRLRGSFEEVAEEGALEDLLDPAYAVVPRTTELAVQRGQKL